MSLLDKTRMIERLQFFDGMRLFGDDLQGLEAFNREMRWLHNSSLHQPGLGNGFAVYGQRGDREVTIGAGYAIDNKGREIVLTQGRKEPVPPVAGDPADGSPVVYDLVVSYPGDELLEEAETRAGICDSRGVTRLREEPLFCWVRYKLNDETGQYVAVDPRLGTEIESGVRLVLTRVEVQNCKLKKDISLSERRNARPAKVPLIACNTFTPDPWEPYWLLDLEDLITALAERFKQLIISPQPAPAVAASARGAATRRARSQAAFAAMIETVPGLAFLGPWVLPLGMQALVVTRLGGVRAIPSYFTRISGERIVEINLVSVAEYLGLIDRSLLASDINQQLDAFPPVRLFIEGLPTVIDPQAAHFTFQAPMMIQLLEIPDLDELQHLTKILTQHVQAQIEKHPLKIMIQACANKPETEQKQCLEDAAREALRIVEDVFIKFMIPPDWEIIWMGIEE